MNHLNQLHRQPLWRGVVLAMLMMAGSLRAQSVPESDHLVYQMQPGDTLLGLVNKHMQSPDALKQLIQANRLTNVNRISVGQKSRFPVGF